MSLDGWPTTRAGWEADWPDRQTRYLAWCNATRRSPLDYDGPAFIAWMDERFAAFRAKFGITLSGFFPPARDDDFDAFLWGETE